MSSRESDASTASDPRENIVIEMNERVGGDGDAVGGVGEVGEVGEVGGGGAPRTFSLHSVATAVRMLTPGQRDIGWNEDNLDNLGRLYIKSVGYEKAHKKCREKNQKYHSVINVPLLACSSFLTLFIAVAGGGNISGLDGQTYFFSEFALTVMMTFLSVINKYFHNDVNAVQHHNTSRQYFTLSQKVKKNIDTQSDTKSYNDIYNKYTNRFIEIRNSSLSIFPRVRKKYQLDQLE